MSSTRPEVQQRATTPHEVPRSIAALFGASATFAVASVVAGFVSRRPQWQGIGLGGALLLAGIGAVRWANTLLRGGPYEEEREQLAPEPAEREALEEDIDRGEAITRRVWIRRSAVAAGGAIAIGAIEPLRSIGPTPGHAPLRTGWTSGARVVNSDGLPVRAAEIPVDGLITVFPEGHTSDADAQVVIVRVDPSLLRLAADRNDWAPDGLVAYSKVCTHAGCPVGLYQSESHQLLCPCHQSSFDVLRGAAPVSGPAAWPLPQLPLSIGDDGILRATGGLDAPVGPGWWRT